MKPVRKSLTGVNIKKVKTMKNITLNLPEQYLNGIKDLVDSGKYESRSDAVREAIRDLLPLDSGLKEDIIGVYLRSV